MQQDAALTGEEIEAVADAVEAVLRRRVADPALVEDLRQETILKLGRVRDRLVPESVVPYAVTIAKNLVIARVRSQSAEERSLARVGQSVPGDDPAELVVRRAEIAAVNRALAELSEGDRDVLIAHVVDERDTASLAEELGATPGGVAARLSRTRARMRVEYLLAARGISLPTATCMPVLLALSAADRRRQAAIGSGAHLVDCETCADLAPPLVERRRNIAAILPIPGLVPLAGTLRRWIGSHPVISASSAGTVVVGGAVVAAAALGGGGEPAAAPRTTSPPTTTTPAPPPPTAPPTVVVDGQPLGSPGLDPDLGGEQGAGVTVDSAVVVDVPANEGFWVDAGSGRRLWVQMVQTGSESPLDVGVDQRVSFGGRLVAHEPGYAETQGVAPEEGAAELDGAGAHVEVPVSDVRVEQP